jgi:hypothetical protein
VAAEPIDVGLEDWMSDLIPCDELAAVCRRLSLLRRPEDVRLALTFLRALEAEFDGRLNDDGEVASLPSG